MTAKLYFWYDEGDLVSQNGSHFHSSCSQIELIYMAAYNDPSDKTKCFWAVAEGDIAKGRYAWTTLHATPKMLSLKVNTITWSYENGKCRLCQLMPMLAKHLNVATMSNWWLNVLKTNRTCMVNRKLIASDRSNFPDIVMLQIHQSRDGRETDKVGNGKEQCTEEWWIFKPFPKNWKRR